MKIIYEARDRQGLKYFSSRPEYISGHDIFTGPRVSPPKRNVKCRLIKRFKAKVTGPFVGKFGYTEMIQVGKQ